MIVNIGGRQLNATVAVRMSDSAWDGRESRAITAELTYQEAVELFANGARWSMVTPVYDDEGAAHAVEMDMSIYAISGPITDNRDGTVTVRMGKYREYELLEIPLADVPKTHAAAVQMRRIIEDAVQSIEHDDDALSVVSLYPTWDALNGVTVDSGFRFRHDGGLFRVLQPHTVGTQWVPGEGTESLYTRIDETHTGTAEDPIPYSGNMSLECGLYYRQDGVLYFCIRDTVNPVYNALSDLTGVYVQAVS